MVTKKTAKKTSKSKPASGENSSSFDFGKLNRSSSEKVIGGVCGGLAEFFKVDPSLVRLVFALLFVFGGSGIILYFILWVILPSDKSKPGITEDNIKKNAEEIKDRAEELSHNFSEHQNSRKFFGVILLVFGLAFLFNNFGFYTFHWMSKLWPLILIALALAILTKGRGRN